MTCLSQAPFTRERFHWKMCRSAVFVFGQQLVQTETMENKVAIARPQCGGADAGVVTTLGMCQVYTWSVSEALHSGVHFQKAAFSRRSR